MIDGQARTLVYVGAAFTGDIHLQVRPRVPEGMGARPDCLFYEVRDPAILTQVTFDEVPQIREEIGPILLLPGEPQILAVEWAPLVRHLVVGFHLKAENTVRSCNLALFGEWKRLTQGRVPPA